VGQKLHDHDGGKRKLKVELTSTHSNPLLGRKEVKFRVIDSKITPSRSQIRIQVAAALQAELDQVYVREIITKSGTRQTSGLIHVYDDPEEAREIEPEYVLQRNKAARLEENKEE
jgi:small subunit ribosomal protein S24e